MNFEKPLSRNCPWLRFSGCIGIDQRHFKCDRCGDGETHFLKDGMQVMGRAQARFVYKHKKCAETASVPLSRDDLRTILYATNLRETDRALYDRLRENILGASRR